MTKRSDETTKSARNCAPSAAISSTAPAWRGSEWASASTATGPMANQELHGACSSRPGRSSPDLTSGSHEIAIPRATAIGTIASGNANSSGTNPSCVAGARPNGVSNRTSIASTRTSRHTSAGRTANPWGGRSSHEPAHGSGEAHGEEARRGEVARRHARALRARRSRPAAPAPRSSVRKTSPPRYRSAPGRTLVIEAEAARFLVQVSRYLAPALRRVAAATDLRGVTQLKRANLA